MILLDSTALIDIMRGKLKLDEVVSEDCATTLINIQEVAFGLSQKESVIFDELIEQIVVLDYKLICVKGATKLFRDLTTKGVVIPRFDCLIAGTMITHNINRILTRDAKHFDRVPGIVTVSY